MAEQFTIPTVGDLVAGKYRIDEELGRGAYGVVFKAHQDDIDRTVAVKTLLPQAFLQQDIVDRFQREAQLISRLDDPHIIKLYDYGVDDGLLYMVVEYVEGQTLQDVIEEQAPLDPSRVRVIALAILDALEHAHTEGIVHRDLKPENIVLLTEKPLEGIVGDSIKILDFGISKLIQDEARDGALKSLTQDGTVLGTPHYMSPENIVGDPVDHRADLYAFGVILHEMLTGEHPFDAPSASAVMVRHLRDDPPGLPPDFGGKPLQKVVARCLEKQPFDRISSAHEIREVLESPTAFDVPSPQPDENDAGTVGGRTGAIATAAVIVAILFVSIGWKVWYATGVASEENSHAVAGEKDGLESEAPVEREAEPDSVDEPGEPPPAVVADEAPDAGVESDEAEPAAVAGTRDEPPESADDDKEPAVDDPAPPADDEPEEDDEVARSDAPETSDAPPDDKKQEPEAADEVQIEISSVPTNASVTIDGVPVGSTPLDWTVPKSEQTVRVKLTHIGYKQKTVTVKPTKNRTIRAKLAKERLQLVD